MTKLEDWIDFLEDEAGLGRSAKLKLLMEHSPSDRIVFENLKELRQLIQKSDPALGIQEFAGESQFMNSLHEAIMKRVNGPTSDLRRSQPQSVRRTRGSTKNSSIRD